MGKRGVILTIILALLATLPVTILIGVASYYSTKAASAVNKKTNKEGNDNDRNNSSASSVVPAIRLGKLPKTTIDGYYSGSDKSLNVLTVADSDNDSLVYTEEGYDKKALNNIYDVGVGYRQLTGIGLLGANIYAYKSNFGYSGSLGITYRNEYLNTHGYYYYGKVKGYSLDSTIGNSIYPKWYFDLRYSKFTNNTDKSIYLGYHILPILSIEVGTNNGKAKALIIFNYKYNISLKDQLTSGNTGLLADITTPDK